MQTPSDQSYREIPLTQGKVAIVDAADYDWLMQWKWHAHFDPHTKTFYARRNQYLGRQGRRSRQSIVLMHRAILGLGKGRDVFVDHKNGDTVDNRRENLRTATHAQNVANARTRSDNTTGVKGVSRKGSRYVAQIQIEGKVIHLGCSRTLDGARHLYEEAVKKARGEFARLS